LTEEARNDGGDPGPRVTIVIPCFRQAHYLKECVGSVVAQNYQNWEVIVVDDESPDHDQMRRVIDGFDNPDIRIIRHPQNSGLAAARNTGIRESSTEFVLPLDSDDKIEPDCLESMVPVLAADPKLDCVFADVQRFGRSTELTEFHGPPIGEKVVRVEDTLPGAGTMMRKSFWERVGGYDEAPIMRRGREDFEFYIRAFSLGCRSAHVAKPLYLYRISHSSMVTAAAAYDDEIFDYIYDKHRDMFDAEGESQSFLAAGYDSAALGSHRDGRRWRAMQMAWKAWRAQPNGNRARAILRSVMSPQVHATLRNGWVRSRIPFARYPLRGNQRYRPFFVIGVARSGNTLLRRVLTAHSELHIPPETFVLGACIQKFRGPCRRMKWPDVVASLMSEFEFHPEFHTFNLWLGPLVERLCSLPGSNRNLAAIFNAFYQFHAQEHGVTFRRWGDKTPMNSLDRALVHGEPVRRLGHGIPQTLKRLTQVFPDAQFIHIYRDGCDVVQSFLSGGFMTDVAAAAERWIHTDRQCRNFVARYPDRCTAIRYEDLIQTPEAAARKLCEFLNVEFEPQMVTSEKSAPKLGDVAEWYWHGQVHAPINPNNTGKGRTNLVMRERKILQDMMGKDLELLGYRPATAEPGEIEGAE